MPEAKQKSAYSAVRKTGKLPVHGAEDLAWAIGGVFATGRLVLLCLPAGYHQTV